MGTSSKGRIGSPAWCSGMTSGGWGGEGRNTRIHIADPRLCTAETQHCKAIICQLKKMFVLTWNIHLGYAKSFQSCATLCNAVACQAPLSIRFSRQGYGVGCHALLQGIFPTQGSNLRLLSLLHWQSGSLPLVPSGKAHMFGPVLNESCICIAHRGVSKQGSSNGFSKKAEYQSIREL